MFLKLEDIKKRCHKLLSAVDPNNISYITELLELYSKDSILYLTVTSQDYVVEVKVPISDSEEFHATVNATLFLKLISQFTTDQVELTINGNQLDIKADGKYSLPLVYENDTIVTLPKIEIENVTNNFTIDSSILTNINTYNIKELNKDGIMNPVQKMFYIDKHGCITFTTGACITEFELQSDISILLPLNVVKLFKLFNSSKVDFTIGQDDLNGIIQTKVIFKDDMVTLGAILVSDSGMVSSVPKDAIRKMATDTYDYSIVINRQGLLNAINRLLLFNKSDSATRPYGKFKFDGTNNMLISDKDEHNTENIRIENMNVDNYEMLIDLMDVKSVIESSKDEFITINFGNHQSVVVKRPGVYNVIPECV